MKILISAFIFFTYTSVFAQEKFPVILDADTGNEVDDLYAIARALLEPTWEVKALNATQWQASQWAMNNTMEESHRLNIMLVAHLDRRDVKTRRGGIRRMYDWGDKAQHSAAAYEIIKQALAMPEGQKLNIVILGALTNVASALLIDPEVGPKIVVYWLGTSYDFDTNTSKRIDFNAAMDVQAVEIMLSSDVEMHIMPHNVATAMKFDYEETKRRLAGKHPLGDFLVNRWTNHMDGARKQRTILDLAIVQAIIFPDEVVEVQVDIFENPNVWIYKSVDGDALRADFFEVMEAFF